jgi:hypothetical protein
MSCPVKPTARAHGVGRLIHFAAPLHCKFWRCAQILRRVLPGCSAFGSRWLWRIFPKLHGRSERLRPGWARSASLAASPRQVHFGFPTSGLNFSVTG